MDDQPTEDTEDNKKSILSNLSSQDIKLLVITFAGTVAANIVTVLLVALAIIVARSFHPVGTSPWPYVILLAETAMGVIAVQMVTYTLRRRRSGGERHIIPGYKAIKGGLIIAGVFNACLLLIFVLAWIGFAAGIK